MNNTVKCLKYQGTEKIYSILIYINEYKMYISRIY